MMRSLYAGVSGLKNHQTRMDVIGNNISNVNTHGFKTERVTFQDMISQQLQGAAAPKEEVGGVNPKQVGLGMMLSAIDKIMTQGSLQNTNKQTDLAISGEGFFVVTDGEKKYYTRAGAFDVDKNGSLVNPATGMRVQGWNSVEGPSGKNINSSGSVENINIPLYSKEPAKETSYVQFKSNLNSAVLPVPEAATDTERYNYITHPDPNMRRGHITSINVYDDQGRQHNLKVFLWKSDVNRWTASVGMTDATQLTLDVLNPNADQNIARGGNTRFELNFTPDGRLSSAGDGSDIINQGELGANLSFRLNGNPEAQNINLRFGTANLVEGITQFSSQFTTKAIEQDGKTMGYLETFTIDNSGVVTGVYSNGTKQPLAQVAMANFTNPEGLRKAGETNYEVSSNSGNAIIGEAGAQGLGEINAGMLEMSNVDLAEQFTDMIVTQRGFQANSKSITTSDQMLQELLTLKR